MSSFETAVVRVKGNDLKFDPRFSLTVHRRITTSRIIIAALWPAAADFLRRITIICCSAITAFRSGICIVRPNRPSLSQGPDNCCEVTSPARATCYRAQCLATTAAFVKLAGVPKERYSVSFQSRLGKTPWLKPYTDYELLRLEQEGKKKMLVICPAFVSDCLETIEEIGMRGCEDFMRASRQEFTRIPCMNEHPLWIEALEKMVARFAVGQPANVDWQWTRQSESIARRPGLAGWLAIEIKWLRLDCIAERVARCGDLVSVRTRWPTLSGVW
jgi:ferrochelatase